MTRPSTYTISELAEAAGTTPRTVRYYTAEGLLPPPDARGRYAVYSNEHLDRLCLIGRLKDAHQPLNAIRERLELLSCEDVQELLAESISGRPGDSLDDLLIRSAETIRARSRLSYHPEGEQPGDVNLTRNWELPAVAVMANESEIDRYVDREADIWQHVVLAPGVELQVRVPLTAEHREAIERMKRYAARLFTNME